MKRFGMVVAGLLVAASAHAGTTIIILSSSHGHPSNPIYVGTLVLGRVMGWF